MLTKSLRPLPDKWKGLADVEKRYRQRCAEPKTQLRCNPAPAHPSLRRWVVHGRERSFECHRRGLDSGSCILRSTET